MEKYVHHVLFLRFPEEDFWNLPVGDVETAVTRIEAFKAWAENPMTR